MLIIHCCCFYLESKMLMTDIKLGGRYRLGKKIGSGSFGEIYTGT